MSDRIYKVNDVIEINNNESYVIVSKVNYRDVDYYYIVLLDNVKNVLKDVCKIIRIDNKDGIDVISLVEEVDILEGLIPLFKKQYSQGNRGDMYAR